MTASASAPALASDLFASMASLSHTSASASASASPFLLLPPSSSSMPLGSGHLGSGHPGSEPGSESNASAPFSSFSSGRPHGPVDVEYPSLGMGTGMGMGSYSGSIGQAQSAPGGYGHGCPPSVYTPPPSSDSLFGLFEPSRDDTAYPSHCFPPPSAYMSSSLPSSSYPTADTHHYDHHDLELELLAFYQHQQPDHSAIEPFHLSTAAFPTMASRPSATAHSGSGSGSDDTASDSAQPFNANALPPSAATATSSATSAGGARTKARSTAKRKSQTAELADPNTAPPVITTRSTTLTALGPEAAQHIAKNRGQRWTEKELSTLQAGVAKHGRNFVAIYNDHGPNGKVDTALARIPSVRAIHAKWLRLTMVERRLAKEQEKSAGSVGDVDVTNQAGASAGDDGTGVSLEEARE
ncbi:hypothetical protein BCR44DRAFT_39859 [Catenaria anguillulae PL171]|uniref:Myb-like domain-containing protein n=1 Tax=Catenaria anguillulae PL171 TaxID=765915 RepID=A0A1Y2H9Q3_9FUNG|nr:hypothetical protein BCR44DRAFT_39859 [Catenaria anguillulae PL171]